MTNFEPTEEQKITAALKSACSQVRASPSFKQRLHSRLLQEGAALQSSPPRKLWTKPFVWAPVAAVILILVIVFATMGPPGQSPSFVAPAPVSSTSTALILTTPSTEPETTLPVSETDTPITSGTSTTVSPSMTTTSTPFTNTTSTPFTSTTVLPSTTTTISTTTTSPVLAGTGFLRILVTDAAPQHDVTEINVILSNVQVSKEVDGEEDSWITVVPEGKSFDLIKLGDADLKAFLGEAELETGMYTQVRMDVEIIDAVIDGGRVAMSVSLPSGKLRLVTPFEILDSQITVVTLDFDVEQSLVYTGNDKVLFKPVVKVTVEYE